MRHKLNTVLTKWVDTNKGDDEDPIYRSRMVVKEFNNEHIDKLFAGAPPLEAFRFLIHEAATERTDGQIGSKVLMINYVARAFFGAPAVRNIFPRSRTRI